MSNQRKELSFTPLNDGTGEGLATEVYYSKGGMNYFSGSTTPRGYYVSVRPESRGNGSRSFMMFSGVGHFLEPAKMFSQKKLDAITPAPEVIDALTQRVMASRHKKG